MSNFKPVGGKLLSTSMVVLSILTFIGFAIVMERFGSGLGAVTNLNNGYPWGLWVVMDIVVGTGFACGGFVLAFVVYVLNKGKYHPLVRPAILASLFGYAMGGLSAFIDMGRYWNFYNMLLPQHQNYNSVLLEVALCVAAYVVVLMIEFAPAALEARKSVSREKLEKILFFFIAVGILLPMMHQSSLGSLLISLGQKVDPLWQSQQLMPLMALVSVIIMGFSIVIFEASFSALGFKRPTESRLLSGLAGGIVWLLAAWLVLRFGDLGMRGALGNAFAGDLRGNMFLLETLLFAVPLAILAIKGNRSNGALLLVAAVSMLLAGSLYRINAFLIGFNASPGYTYFPSAGEIMVTVGIISFEILLYILVVRRLPVLHAPAAA